MSRIDDEYDLPTERDLRMKGFEPGEPVYVDDAELFYREDLMRSLCSTYDEMTTVAVGTGDGRTLVKVVVGKVEARYQPVQEMIWDKPAGCHKYPDWYFEGWVPRSGFDPFREITRIRGYIISK